MACHRVGAVGGEVLWSCDEPWDWAALLVRLARHDERGIVVGMMAKGFSSVEYELQPAAVQAWVQENIRYEDDSPPERLKAWLAGLNAGKPGDPFERFGGPETTLARGAGDCDCSARLVRAVVRRLGHPCRLVFLGTRESPQHVAAAIPTSTGYYWLDASLDADPGEHPFDARNRLDNAADARGQGRASMARSTGP